MHSSKQIFELFFYDFNEIEFSENIFGVSCNIKFNENSPCGSRVFMPTEGLGKAVSPLSYFRTRLRKVSRFKAKPSIVLSVTHLN